MQIYVGKNGQQLGPFSLEEVNRKLADQTFAGTDLAWYEGAAGWAPLSSVAGVVIPAPTPATPTSPSIPAAPAPTPAPAPIPAPAPVRSNASIVQPPAAARSYTTLARIAWALLGVTLIVACIPILGCGTWILVWPVALAAIILGIIVMARGGTGQGIMLIIAAVVLVPLALVAPVFSTALLGGKQERQDETRIMENLRTIDGAKEQWIKAMKAPTGLEVTMSSLTTYLNGKEIKPVVDERYDPAPVGQPPTATLPATKSLGGFKAGEVLTVASIEKDLAAGWVSWMKTTTSTSSLSGSSPTPITALPPSPKPSVSAAPLSPPAERPSPKPEASPKSTSPPRSLIQPRATTPPSEFSPPPRTGPSPSAKFAPRDGPQTNPRQAPSQHDPGVPRQGKQRPSDSPSASPEEEDDE